MNNLILNTDYTNKGKKYWLESNIKNTIVTPEKGETVHDTVQRVLTDADYVEFSYGGRPRGNIFVDIKDKKPKRVGYIYKVKADINNVVAFFTVWVTVKQVIDIEIEKIN